MAQEKKDNRIILKEATVTAKLLEGAEDAYAAVSTSYGPRGKNWIIEMPFGMPKVTRDGTTIVRDVYFSDRAKNMGAQLLMQASEITNSLAGDGTSLTTLLGHQVYKKGLQAIASGIHPMEVEAIIQKDTETLLDGLKGLTKQVKGAQLKDVATVSSGSELFGELISDAINHVGADGGIITEKAYVSSVETEYVDGYFLQPGFEALQSGKKEISNPHVVVSVKRIASAADANELLTKILTVKGVTQEDIKNGNVPRVVFIGNIEEAAIGFIVNLINKGMIDGIILKTPPAYGNMGKYLLEDIAVYAGCEVIADGTSMKAFTPKYVGTVERIVASKAEASLFQPPIAEGEDAPEALTTRISEIKDQLSTETVPAILEKLRDRIAKLEGKVALFRIGGATDTEKEEIEYRIEDAINATRAAAQSGIVAGGGITLLELSKLDISDLYRNALRAVFSQLLINANLPAELKLDEALKAPKGFGYNLREGDKLVDMLKAGIIDPALVVEQAITNASSIAGKMLTIGGGSIFEDKKD